VALACVLLVGAGLLIRSYGRMIAASPGFEPERRIALSVALPETRYVTPAARSDFFSRLLAQTQALPGVQSAALASGVPPQGGITFGTLEIEGQPRAQRSAPSAYGGGSIAPGFFRTLGIRIRRGRGFTASDDAGAPMVLVINEALAKRYFPGEDPVGVALDRGLIVGVIADVLQVGLDRPSEPEIYYAAAQNVTMAPDIGMSLVVRTDIPPERASESIRAAIRAINPKLAIFNVRTMTQVVSDSMWELRLYRWLIGVFAVLALLLAAIGLHGVISYNVTSRMREFAVRLALGSDPGDLTRLVVKRALLLAGAGLAGGIISAMAITPFVRTLPIGPVAGPSTYGIVSVALIVIALAACLVPALRVARVNPAAALRHE